MSANAGGRVRDLRGMVLVRLRDHQPLVDLLGRATGADMTRVVVPAAIPSLYRRDPDSPAPPDVAIAVSVVTGSSQRENAQERVNLVAQTDVQLTPGALLENGLAWHDEVLDEVSAVLTEHEGIWRAMGESGGTPEPLWDEDVDRYRSVQRFDVQRWD